MRYSLRLAPMTEPLLLQATQDDVYEIAQRRWPDTLSRRLYGALAEVAPNGAWVAKDEGAIVGVALPHALEQEWFLSDLFVEPSFRHAGLGWRLLCEATREADAGARSGLLDARERDGALLFARLGVPIATPVLQLAGRIPTEEELATMLSGEHRFDTESIDLRRDRHALGEIDLRTRGSERDDDHAYFAAQASGAAFFLRDEFVGYAYAWPDGRIGPLAAVSPTYLVAFFAFAMISLVRRYAASWCTALVPGCNVRVMRAAVRAGLRVDAMKLFATDSTQGDLSQYVGFHSLLF